ncbi:MAG TPA: hypothetical protein G4O20_07945 [Dehalococcoidia bacterium]|nr:hypothetical protein [Dehalococcoidia bacterium]
MKKILLIALVALVVVTGGMFAYTFTTATATIGVTAPTSDFANVTAGSSITAPTVFGNFSGTWPSSTLFDIDPDPNYQGDLVITVYLVNAAQLVRQYHHVNMTLEFQDSTNTTADEQGTIQVLTLDNAEALFTWSNGTGTSPYKLVLTGGSFRLHPFKALTGGSYQPQIWCEITQR